ncbi:MAG: metallophosphoesterase family protein [Thermoleophilia bacterium]|nr:metallophosphoesterase family protein [Thermoleophilia bacterium]
MASPLRVAVVADLHGRLPAVPPADLLVVAGDFCPMGSAERQRSWIERELRPWLERQEAPVVAVAGNCDLVAAADPELVRSLRWTYLEDEAAEVLGRTVFGSPLALPFGSWPFMASEERLAEVWARIPEATELLVVHGPPHGLGDRAASGAHAGSVTLRKRIDALPSLRAVVFGHIHEARGRGRVGGYEWVNAAVAGRDEAAPTLLELS